MIDIIYFLDMAKIIDAFDRVSASDLSVLHPGERQISPETTVAYLNTFTNETDRAFAKTVLELTRYVPESNSSMPSTNPSPSL